MLTAWPRSNALVRDTGIGIAPEHLDHLFKNFAQGDKSINRKFGGTGLGLAISQKIIEQMGGKIKVKSTPGNGATFSFELKLPLSDIAVVKLTEASEAVDRASSTLAGGAEPLRILLAEDNGTNQLVFSKMLQDVRVKLTIAQNGREAVEHACNGTFDAIFMDMRMPEMDGLEATRTIRALEGHLADIPIIALTANAFADDIKACRDAGMNDFVAKPLRKKILIEKLANVVSGHRNGANRRKRRGHARSSNCGSSGGCHDRSSRQFSTTRCLMHWLRKSISTAFALRWTGSWPRPKTARAPTSAFLRQRPAEDQRRSVISSRARRERLGFFRSRNWRGCSNIQRFRSRRATIEICSTGLKLASVWRGMNWKPR